MRGGRGAVAIAAVLLAGAGCSNSSAAPAAVDSGITPDPGDAGTTVIDGGGLLPDGDSPTDARSTAPDAFVSDDGFVPIFSGCDSSDAEGACTTGPMGFDGGADASYPAGCFALFGSHDGCTCGGNATVGYSWGCTLK